MRPLEKIAWREISDALSVEEAEEFFPTAKRASFNGKVRVKKVEKGLIFKVPATQAYY